ncbi:MAG: beta strand repeat-containing protein, partial [Niastella sp.]|uniref:beta strand repeat-containing protein n=1 Tax=Niastella sp. TaxID=1869183 RepID=UPI0038999D60
FDEGHGNTSTAYQNVFIHDLTAPVAPTLADVTGECTATATAPTTTDNCAGTITGTTTDPLTYSTQGTHVIHWTFDDGNGNTSTANQNVVIHDVTAPVAPTLADVTGECTATATAPTTTDNCSGTITGTTTDPLTYTSGTHVIHWSFDDGHGNISTANQNVVIHDVTAPVAPTLADVTGECTATATAPTTTDNCAGTITGTTTDPLTYSTQGTHVIHWTFDDGHGNTSTADQNVVIHDVTAPVAPTLADVTGECTATATAPTTTDNCSGTITGTTTDPLTYTSGTHVIHWTFDDGHGNTSTANQNVVIHDVTAPVAPTLADVTGECTATATAPTTTDNCAGTITGTTTDPLTYSTQGTHVIHWSFDDGHGNISTANQNVVIHDVTAPVAPTLADVTGECTATATAPTTTDNCSGTITGTTTDPLTYTSGSHVIHWSFNDGNSNISTANQNVIIHDVTPPVAPVLADVTGECTATATAPTTTDNCAGTVTGTTTDPVTYTSGTHVIHWSFNDGHGNISTANQNVVIQDVTAPVTPTLGDVTGECTATATAPTTTDNCAGTITGTTADPLTYTTQGTHVIHWTFDDGNGNTSTANQNVIIHDVTAPVTPTLADVTGECTATATAPTTTDNCAGTITGTTTDPLTYSTQGTHVIHWSFDDGHGNTSSATQNVIIHDLSGPTITTAAGSLNTTLECDDAAGLAAALTLAPAAIDNCSGSTTIHLVTDVTTADPTCPHGYVRVRTWNFTDGQNNTSPNFAQTITVQDHTPPFVIQMPADVTVDADANCQATGVNLGILSAQDNCSNAVIITNDHPGIYPIGTTIVTWTIKDSCNNSITRQQTVRVIDHTNPVISNCPNDITVFTGAGALTCSKGVSWTPPSASDNCGSIASFTSNYTPGAVFPVGTTLVTYVATDASTNSSTCSFNVNVVDNTPPVISNCPGNIVTCNPSVTWTAPTATDNCGVNSFTNDAPATFTAPVTTVTYTAKDAAGNTTTCSFTVTLNPTPTALAASNSPVCAGNTLSLSAGGGASYSWSGPNGFSSNLQNPSIAFATTAASGTYTVTVSNSFGCSATTTTNVVVNTGVTATASSNSPVCSGSTLTLIASGGVSYSWTGPNGYVSLQQNPIINNATTTASGIYTVTVTNASGCTAQAFVSATVSAGINALATNNGPVCEGASLSLSAAGGSSYSWSGPNGFSSTQQNPSIPTATLAASGTYTVTVSGGGGCSATTSTNVTVNTVPTPLAASNSPVCQGGALSLSAGGGTSYTWSGPNGFSSFQQNPVISNVTPAASGFYTVTVTNASGCSATTTIQAAINAVTPATAASNSPVCTGNPLNLFASAGATYSWSGPNGFSSLQQNPTISATSSAGGIYTVTVTNANGCSSTASTNVVIGTSPVANASSNSPVCTGGNLNLSASGGISYSWSGPNGFSSPQQNPVIANATASAGGAYTITVTNAAGCSASTTINVTVNGAVSAGASSNSPVCTGNTLNLFASGGVSYVWNGPNGFSSTQQNPVIANTTGAASGTYTVTVTTATGCISTTTTDVTVNAAPAANASSNTPV